MDELYDVVEKLLRCLKIPRTIEPCEGDKIYIEYPVGFYGHDGVSFTDCLYSKLEDLTRRSGFVEYYDIRITENGNHGTIEISQGVI